MSCGTANEIFTLIDYDRQTLDTLDMTVRWPYGDPEIA